MRCACCRLRVHVLTCVSGFGLCVFFVGVCACVCVCVWASVHACLCVLVVCVHVRVSWSHAREHRVSEHKEAQGWLKGLSRRVV